jgi:hypothetical protein
MTKTLGRLNCVRILGHLKPCIEIVEIIEFLSSFSTCAFMGYLAMAGSAIYLFIITVAG